MYYAGTISALRETIASKHPEVRATFSEIESGSDVPLSYLLWMCDQVLKMDTSSVDEAVKAGRWIGWVFAHVESAGIWDNRTTRNLVRADRQLGLDKPHQY
jgi:hypothetical protein